MNNSKNNSTLFDDRFLLNKKLFDIGNSFLELIFVYIIIMNIFQTLILMTI